MKTASAALQDPMPGQVIVQRVPSGYYLVQIGRLKYTKRFNLSPAEAEALIDELSRLLSSRS